MTVALNQPVPDFSALATSGQSIQLAKLSGQNVVLYFYPKDATPFCTIESRAFRNAFSDFKKCDCVILGVSKDTLAHHEKFKKSHSLPFELIW